MDLLALAFAGRAADDPIRRLATLDIALVRHLGRRRDLGYEPRVSVDEGLRILGDRLRAGT